MNGKALVIGLAKQAAATEARPEPELMPNCTTCGEHSCVSHSVCPERGTHYCWVCMAWFTPPSAQAGISEEDIATDIDLVADKSLRESDDAKLAKFYEQKHAEVVGAIVGNRAYRTLNYEFLRLMDEIGVYGLEKYGDESMEAKFRRGDFRRTARTETHEIGDHISNHYAEYERGVAHDKFSTRKHQLAAAAFNAMMEYVFFINECRKEMTV